MDCRWMHCSLVVRAGIHESLLAACTVAHGGKCTIVQLCKVIRAKSRINRNSACFTKCVNAVILFVFDTIAGQMIKIYWIFKRCGLHWYYLMWYHLMWTNALRKCVVRFKIKACVFSASVNQQKVQTVSNFLSFFL